MFENGYKKEDLNYKNKPIEVYKRDTIQLADADYFYEEIRRTFSKFGQEKLYSDGLIIKTALNSKFKERSLKPYRKLIEYEKRKGWHGIIDKTNMKNFLDKKLL